MNFYKNKKLLFFCIYVFLCLKINAQNNIKIDDDFSGISLLNHIEIADNNHNNYTVDKLKDVPFKTVTKARMGRSDGNYWLKFNIQNTSNSTKKIYLTNSPIQNLVFIKRKTTSLLPPFLN